MHLLDNVIWNALTTRQANFAQASGDARRFIPEVTTLAGMREPTAAGYESLKKLAEQSTLGLFLIQPYEQQPGWTLVASAPLLQMVWEDRGAAPHSRLDASGLFPSKDFPSDVIELDAAAVPEMIELTSLTRPGPFNRRTRELGTYVGVRREGKLVAMAGERLKVPGFTEVSAVCTHPEHTGRGYGGALMSEVMRRIRQRGETPFLHVREDNLRAIGLYQKLGFRKRAQVHLAVLRKAVSGN
jgi:ribosomal protein S18 acetylase RimI-like enzyme